jgi:hypothetical protein
MQALGVVNEDNGSCKKNDRPSENNFSSKQNFKYLRSVQCDTKFCNI